MWLQAGRRAVVVVHWERSASVWRVYWFSSARHRRIPFALTALSLTYSFFLFLFFLLPLQIIGRVNADPDYLPRAMDFGLNVSGFLEHFCPPDCPPAFFPMAAMCCDLDADKRSDIYHRLI